jgi:multidrug efflux pump subunit AcrA (membrane-fusion protein)
MRYGNEEASTHRRSERPARPPEFLPEQTSDHEPTFARGTAQPVNAAGYNMTPYTQQSAHQRSVREPVLLEKASRSRSSSRSYSAAKPVRQETESISQSLPAEKAVQTESVSRSLPAPPVVAPKARSSSKSSYAATPTPAAPAPAPQPAPAAAAMPGMIDPMVVPVPPELAGPIYGWVRRLALQADLVTADRVLRDGLCELTSSLSVSIVYPGQDGLWSLGGDDEIPKDAQPLVAVAHARRALIASHTALIPIVTTTETVAVIILTRNPRNPAYLPIEQLAMLGLARESASILHHLAVQHLQRASEIKADKGGLYRGEALEAHRTRGQEGSLIQLSPAWIRRAYPMLIGTLLIALLFTVFITIPTYSTGSGIVILDGMSVTAPAAGTVDQVLVAPGQAVKTGTILVRMASAFENDDLINAKTELANATRLWLFDQTDENVKKQLASVYARMVTAQSKVDQRTIRAKKPGTVSDIRVRQGALLQPGDHILSIIDPARSEPEIWAFLPAKDRPRLRIGMPLQVELSGYTKSREQAIITFVSPEATGSAEAQKTMGATIADAVGLPQGGSYVLVKARLPKRTFETEHHTFHYHHGMQATTEVKISSKPFLVTLLPALEKYLPD